MTEEYTVLSMSLLACLVLQIMLTYTSPLVAEMAMTSAVSSQRQLCAFRSLKNPLRAQDSGADEGERRDGFIGKLFIFIGCSGLCVRSRIFWSH